MIILAENDGYNDLAKVIHGRILKTAQDSDAHMAIDFGQIQSDGSLRTNSFPVGIPAGGYLVCGNLLGIECTGGTTIVEGHTHGVSARYPQRIGRGSRVLVVWVGNDPIVIDVIHEASEVL